MILTNCINILLVSLSGCPLLHRFLYRHAFALYSLQRPLPDCIYLHTNIVTYRATSTGGPCRSCNTLWAGQVHVLRWFCWFPQSFSSN